MRSRLFGHENSSPNIATPTFHSLSPNYSGFWSATEVNRVYVIPCAMTISDLYVDVTGAPGSGKSFTFTIMKNGVATDLALTIADSALSGISASNLSATFAPGDTVSMRLTTAGSPTNPGAVAWDMLVDASGPVYPIFGRNNDNTLTASDGYSPIIHGNSIAWSATLADFEVVIPCGGVLSNLYMLLEGTPGSGKSYTITVIKNGVATDLTVSVAGTSTSGLDSTHQVSVSAGDTLVIKLSPSGTPTSRTPTWSMVFTPANYGDFFIGMGSAQVPSASATNWEGTYGIASNGWGGFEPSEYHVLGKCTLKKMYIKIGTAPGGSGTRVFTFRKNGASTALAVTISGSNTTGSVVADASFVRADRSAIQSAITGTPAAMTGGLHMGVLLNVEQLLSSVPAMEEGMFFDE